MTTTPPHCKTILAKADKHTDLCRPLRHTMHTRRGFKVFVDGSGTLWRNSVRNRRVIVASPTRSMLSMCMPQWPCKSVLGGSFGASKALNMKSNVP